MKSSLRITEVWGIPIKLHISFLIILPIFVWVFANTEFFFAFLLNESTLLAYGFATLLAVLFFVCIVLHELGHSYVALKSGIDISSITLMIFGGVSSMENPKEDPAVEWRLAIAGPLVSIAIGTILLGSALVLGFRFPLFRVVESIPAIFLGWLGYINFVLAGFNLIPAFPMDGGRILRSVLARRMSYIKATEKAAGVGRVFAFALGLLGLLTVAQGGIWFILIAAFIYIGASEEEKATKLSGALSNKNVVDLMTKDVISVSSDMSLAEVVEFIKNNKHMGYPVVDDGELIGMITFSDIQRVEAKERENVKVVEVMSTNLVTVKPDTDAYTALIDMSKQGIGRLPVVENNNLVGIVTRTDFTRAIQISGFSG